MVSLCDSVIDKEYACIFLLTLSINSSWLHPSNEPWILSYSNIAIYILHESYCKTKVNIHFKIKNIIDVVLSAVNSEENVSPIGL